MDLDSSLDDLIKKRRQSKSANSNKKAAAKQQQQSHKNKQQQHTRPSIQTNKAKVTKPNPPQRSGINARLVIIQNETRFLFIKLYPLVH
jgi:hypothetical protein